MSKKHKDMIKKKSESSSLFSCKVQSSLSAFLSLSLSLSLSVNPFMQCNQEEQEKEGIKHKG
jgi:hypothetical protein